MDLEQFRARAARKKEKLSFFLDQFETLVPGNLPEIVAEADEAVWKETDCTTCANCCKTMTPTFTKTDIARIAAHLGMTEKEFKAKWLYKEKETGDWLNTTQPCQFLENNKCSIYEVRPADCAEFPHHNKKPFDDYYDTFRANLVHCPATLALVEKVKKRVTKEYEWPKPPDN